MDLSSKLKSLLPQQTKPTPSAKRAVNLDPTLAGRELDTPFGPCYVVEKQLPLSEKHGYWPLHEVLKANYFPSLDKSIFLDTETTGLAGGTGTYAFLVGLGYFTPNHFVIKQLLMRDYNEELGLLYLLDQELQTKDTIISFNGKSFDLPLLQTRFAISRLGFPSPTQKDQLDLLHLSRRLWRKKLTSCSLESLEKHILGVQRHGDIPGFEIPQRYFEFLQTGDGQLLKNIVQHNLVDIVSMATLLYRLQITLELAPVDCDCPFEAESLANLALRRGKHSLALQYLEAAMQLSENDEHYIRVLRQTGAILKRLGQYKRASLLWKKVLQILPTDLSTSEELAKYYEHRLKDFSAAEQVTRRALAVAWQSRSPRIPALEHRLNRLERKLQKHNIPASN